MPSNSLIKQIKTDFPKINFILGDEFKWSARSKAVTYDTSDPNWKEHLLHEIAHASLNHHDCQSDAELIDYEVSAWQFAKNTLASKYNLEISDETCEEALETYREWLHKRSLCPNCTTNGLEQIDNTYYCVACDKRWKVTDRNHSIPRRYVVKQ
jgi:hypothetical protein